MHWARSTASCATSLPNTDAYFFAALMVKRRRPYGTNHAPQHVQVQLGHARDCLTAPSLVPRKQFAAQRRHADFDRFPSIDTKVPHMPAVSNCHIVCQTMRCIGPKKKERATGPNK